MTEENIPEGSKREATYLYEKQLSTLASRMNHDGFAIPFRAGYSRVMRDFEYFGGELWWKEVGEATRGNFIGAMRQLGSLVASKAESETDDMKRSQFEFARKGFEWACAYLQHLTLDPVVSADIKRAVGA